MTSARMLREHHQSVAEREPLPQIVSMQRKTDRMDAALIAGAVALYFAALVTFVVSTAASPDLLWGAMGLALMAVVFTLVVRLRSG